MEHKGFTNIIAMGIACAVITPTLANVLPVYNSNATHLLNSPIDNQQATGKVESTNNSQNILKVSLVNEPLDESVDKPYLEIDDLSPPLLPQTSPVTAGASPLVNCQMPSDTLWPIASACAGLFYQEVSFAKPNCYFAIPIEMPDSLNVRFWKSITNHDKWDAMMDKVAGRPITPEPAPVGLLGMSILGIASLQQFNNKKEI